MTHRKAIVIIVFCLSCITSSVGMSDDNDIPMRELLLMQDIPMVITPSKVEQSVLESPSTITVLTKEDIRRYGLNSISDILRNVAGVDVMSVSPTDRNISMRGFNRLAAGKILSLVDSRPVYLSYYGSTLWESMPVSIDDIERIEVIKGPGSALYGANAFDGVVNIITNPASLADGTKVIGTVDQSGELGGSVIHSGGSGRLRYKASLGWDKTSEWDKENEDRGENKRFIGDLNYSIDEESCLSLTAGLQNRTGDMAIYTGLDPGKYCGIHRYAELQYGRSSLKCSALWTQHISDSRTGEDHMMQFFSDNFDMELQHSFHLSDSNFLTWGLSYQFVRIDWDAIQEMKNQNLLAGFIQDQFSLSSKLSLTFGLRYDRHPLTGNSVSPRASMVYSPSFGHAFRISAGRAFRNPPILYSYISETHSFTVPMFPVSISIEASGNENLSPEWITAFELGYQGNFGTRLKGGVDIFFNKLDGLIDYALLEAYPADALFPGSPGEIIPSASMPKNLFYAQAYGSEISASFVITRWLSAYANYSYQHVTDTETQERIESAPLHKINSGLSVNLGENSVISLFANYVDKTAWGEVKVNSITVLENEAVDSYTLLNFAASHRLFGGSSEVALSIFNLLGNRHLEHPEGTEVGRSILLKLICRI